MMRSPGSTGHTLFQVPPDETAACRVCGAHLLYGYPYLRARGHRAEHATSCIWGISPLECSKHGARFHPFGAHTWSSARA